MKKANLGAHYGVIRNRMTFVQAYAYVLAHPHMVLHTTGNGTPFTATASLTTKGRHVGEKVIRFHSSGQERERAYHCCWGHKTNCSKTHIDCYTLAMKCAI